jgi:hypothetical protein
MRGCVGAVLLLAIASAPGGCAYDAQKRAAVWSIAETENVLVRASVGPERAAEVAVEVQRIRDMLAGLVLRCAFEAKGEPIRVTVMSESEWNDFAPREMRGQYRSWSITWLPEFEAQIVMPDGHDRELTQLYQHELTHHLVASCFPSAPTWLNEGLAKFLETITEEDGQVLLGVPPYALLAGRRLPTVSVYRGLHIQVLSLERLPSIAHVVAMPSADFYRRTDHDALRAVENYATSWALVHLLELGAEDLRLRFHMFLGHLRRPDADAAALFAEQFKGVDLQARLDSYLRAQTMPYELHRPTPPRKSTARVRPMNEGEAHLQMAWLWAGAITDDDSRDHALAHLAAARERADSRARAHLLTAAILASSGDLERAESEVRAGLRAAPADPDLLQALVELLIVRRADASDAARRLQAVASSGEHLCALSGVELVTGRAASALAYAVRGIDVRPPSWRCRELIRRAREAVQQQGAPARPGS